MNQTNSNVTTPASRELPDRWVSITLALILLIALGLRVWGIGFGLPNLEHPDEDAVLMPALQMVKTGDLEPQRMEYGTFHIYTLVPVSMLVYLQAAQNGRIDAPQNIPIYERGTYPATYPFPEFFLAARLVSALYGTGTVLLIYMLVRRLQRRASAALIAAALAAVLPAFVTHGRFATTDMALTFYVTLSLYLLLRVYDNWEHDEMWAYAGAGFVCGLAASTKFNGVVLAFPLLLVPLLKVRSLDGLLRMRVLIGPLAMAAGFLAGTPYALLNIPEFLNWFGYSLRLYNVAAPGAEPVGTSWQWHLSYHVSSPNAIVFFLGLFGFLLSWRYWGRRGWLLNSLALLLWFAIVTQTRREARMWLPTAPVFVAWAALTVDWLVSFARQRWPRLARPMWRVVLPVVVVIPLLVGSIRIANGFRSDDVRTMTQRWIQENVPAESKLAVEYFAPNLNPEQWSVTRTMSLQDREMAWYQEQGVVYLIASEAGNNPTKMSETAVAARQQLLAEACLLETIRGPFLSAPAITFQVYRVPPCP